MKISWQPAIQDLHSAVEQVRAIIIDSPFDSDFCHKMHLAKVSLADISSRIVHAENMARVEADALRAEINAELRKMFACTSELRTVISDLNLIKVQRNRENDLHIQELKKTAEEGGEE